MRLPIHLSGNAPFILVACLGVGAAIGGGIWFMLHGRKRKSAAELERERRLSVNAIGRMTDGALLEAVDASLLLYQYSVSGVEYSAGQDISAIRPAGSDGLWPGAIVTVKYDPQNPSNSIVLCELWSGLHETEKTIPTGHDIPISWQGAES